ncbi:restriction endonuclease subunit S [Bacillus stercoris]|uniref:restriction endonuclease subunit S n=1 Tax=Bacillus stercoris TaxID=2054641 RepID=UPI00257253CD|nr:restriction endonuclease subunit S [Bacillus stercoris]MDL9994853.1 restriction endonuclease subunit S [Bacillus stercoris]
MSKEKKTIEELVEETIVPVEEQPYELPENWIWVKLLNGYAVCLDKYRKPVNAEERAKRVGNIPYYGATGQVGWIDDYLTDEELVLLGEDGVPFLEPFKNKAYIIREKAWVNNHAHILRSIFGSEGNLFLLHYLNQFNFNGYVSGTTRLKLTQKKMAIIPVPLPPLNEQKRIAEKVERLLSKIEEAKQLIEEAKETFELRRASIIRTILKEELSNGKLPTGWRNIKVKDLFTIFGGGTPSKAKEEYWNGRIPWISAKDMKTTFISKTMDYITEEGLNNSSAKLAKRGSVAMVVRSGILQRTLPVAFLLSECTVNQDLKVFDSGDELINKYFLWYVKGNERNLLHNYSKSGTTVNSIEFEKFKSHEILLPPMDVLKQRIDKIENVIEKEKSANVMLNLANSIDELKSSILSKAFRGELGTNDPSEENAVELLKEVLQEQVK